MDIVIDSREKHRTSTAYDYYRCKGHEPKVDLLEVGDYLFNDQVVFEYKEVGDFMQSINDNSLFHEAANQSLRYPYHYVVIVGDVRDYLGDAWQIPSVWRKWKGKYNKYLYKNLAKYYGALRRLRVFTNVIFCRDETNAFQEMLLQSIKCLDDKSKYYTNMVRPLECQDAVDVLLTSNRGVSSKKASAIRKHHTINNIYDLMTLTEENFAEVEGIGKVTSSNIYQFLHSGDS